MSTTLVRIDRGQLTRLKEAVEEQGMKSVAAAVREAVECWLTGRAESPPEVVVKEEEGDERAAGGGVGRELAARVLALEQVVLGTMDSKQRERYFRQVEENRKAMRLPPVEVGVDPLERLVGG
jgi:hypothetical protein